MNHPDATRSPLAGALTDRYRVEREIGAGGMATVFLARDLRHDRNVAIKVLHEDLGATLGQERFLAEIRTTARLQHPHILPLLDSGSTSDGRLYYVMPFVDGESLRERLTRERQLPIEDAVRIAREVGDALGVAHAQGVIHRDIKPENILLQGGHALVADFGIALAVQHAGGSRMTQTGLSLGTPQYMSPEQAMGDRTIDARADVYALGAVLYEMLTGEPPFTGVSAQAIVAKLLSSEPAPPTTIRRTIPFHVEAAVLKALAKLAADRPATVGAFVDALGNARPSEAHESGARRSVTTARRIRARTAAGVAAGVAIGVAVGWLAWRGRSNAANAGVVRTYMQQPAAEALPAGTSDFTFAPNGDLIYVGPGDRPGTTQLWRKELAGLHATRIDGTIGAGQPFVSPDGKWIAFWSVAGLQRVSAAGGGAAMIIPDLTFSEGRGTWLADGRVMVLARTWIGLVNQDGGKVDVVVDASRFAGFSPMRVAPLPGGRSFFVQTCPPGCSQSVVYHVDLATNAIRVALPQARNPVLLRTGQLAYVTQSGQLTIAPVDVRTGTIGAPARAVADNVSAFDVSPQGDLVYREGQDGVAVRPVNVDRAGRVAIIDSSWVGFFSTGALSPDGKRFVASVISRSEQQLWIKELPRGSFSRFTFDAGDHFRPAWSSDGAFIRYIQHVDTNFVLMEKRADGVGNPRVIPIGPHHAVDVTSSRDGSIAVRTGATDTSKTILILRDATDANPRAAAPEPGLRLSPTVSPDGRFIAYASVAAGNAEIYVSPFPDIESARWQVSRNGGVEPRWSHDGKELFYVSSRDELMAAGVALAPSFSVTSMTTLFRAGSYQHDGGFHTYEPFPDSQHFLMLQRETLPGSLVLTTNWLQAVAARR